MIEVEKFSDLICVLWLSGLQKEDLDVSILRKLQRHDVNIDAMNSEALQRDCLQLQSSKNKSKKESSSGVLKNKTKAVITKIKSTSNIKQIVTGDLNAILANLINNEKVLNNNNTKDSEKESQTLETLKASTDNSQLSYVDEDYTEAITLISDTTEVPKNFVKDDRKQNLEDVLKFWQMFKTTHHPKDLFESTTEKLNLPVRTKEREKQPLFKNKNDQATTPDFMNKLFANYYNHKIPDINIQTTTTPPIDLRKLSKQIETFLDIVSQNEKHDSSVIHQNKYYSNEEHERKISRDMPPWKYHFTGDIPLKSALYSERLRQYNKHQSKLEDSPNTRQDDFPFDSGHKSSVEFEHRNVTPDPVIDIKHQTKYTESHLEKENVTVSPKTNLTKTEEVKMITKDVIKEIADNIKVLVLKDLRQDITTKSTTTISTTSQTTTTGTPTSTKPTTVNPVTAATKTPQVNNTQSPTEVMEKFIDLFEQFKNMKDKTIVKGQMKVKILEERTVRPDYRNLNLNNRAPILLVNSRVKAPLENQPMLYSPLGIQSIPVNKVKFMNLPITSASVVQIHPMTYPRNKQMPIMLQTNSGEIPPLGIPISKPLKLIHQNIIVTTMVPKNSQHEQNFMWIGGYNQGIIQKDHSITPTQTNQLKNNKMVQPKPYRIMPKQQEQGTFQYGRLKNKEETSYSSRQKDDRPKLSEQRSYRSARIKNGDINQPPPRLDDEQHKRTELRPYERQKNINEEDSYRSSQFKDDIILKDKKNPYTMPQHGDRNPIHSIYSNELKLQQQRSYKSSRNRNQHDRHYSPRIEYETPNLSTNARIRNQDDGNYQARLYDVDRFNLSKQSPYRNSRIRNQNTNPQLSFVDDKPNQMEPIFHERENIGNNKETIRQPHIENERLKQLELKMYHNDRVRSAEDMLHTRIQDNQKNERLNKHDIDRINAYDGKTKYPEDQISYASFRNHGREKFHEKLERADDWNDGQTERKEKKLMTFAKRKQQPLNDVKKISTYDDSHFRDFLKTQQKVNDMLEKILATKTFRSGPHSIESI